VMIVIQVQPFRLSHEKSVGFSTINRTTTTTATNSIVSYFLDPKIDLHNNRDFILPIGTKNIYIKGLLRLRGVVAIVWDNGAFMCIVAEGKATVAERKQCHTTFSQCTIEKTPCLVIFYFATRERL
jgi:hypothetical protein